MENQISLEVENTFDELISNLSSLNQQEINTVPFEGSWTAGQLANHLIKGNGWFLQLMNGPVEETDRKPDEKVEGIKTAFLDFSNKFTSPDFIVPENIDYEKESLLLSLEDIKVGINKAIRELDPTKTCIAFEVPGGGRLTRLESVYFVIYHTQRHIHQLKNIGSSLRVNEAHL